MALDREEQLLGSTPRYTLREVAQRTGVPVERLARLWSALGFAQVSRDDVAFADNDIDALRIAGELRAAGFLDAAAEDSLTRALGQTLGRLAQWEVELFAGARGDADLPDPVALWLLDAVEQLQQYVWRRHVLAVISRVSGERTELVVGFADVVGYTSLSRGLDHVALSEFIDAFEATGSEIVAGHGGHVVKTIGDEIMFTAGTPQSGAEIALELAGRLRDLDNRPDLRVGVAYGEVLEHLADVFGTVVNIAARLTAVARPGTVLIDREFADALTGDERFEVRPLRRVSVRGFERLQPWLLRRAR